MIDKKDFVIPTIMAVVLVALLAATLKVQTKPAGETYAAGGRADYCRMTVANFNENPLKTCNPSVPGYLGGKGYVSIVPALDLTNNTIPNPIDTRCSVIQWDGNGASSGGEVFVQYSADNWNYCRYEEGNDHCRLDDLPNGVGPFNNANQEKLRQQFIQKCQPPLTATSTVTPPATNTLTPTPTTPPATNTLTPPPTAFCEWEQYSNAKWSTTNQNGWLDQWRQHTTYSSYKNKNTPKLLKTFTVNQKKDVRVMAQQIQVNDNDGGSCNPQFNEEAWVGIYKLNASGQGTQLVASHLFTDGNYDLVMDSTQVYQFVLDDLDAGTYGVSSVWAGDGRNGPDFNPTNNRLYTDPENSSRKYDYSTNPPQLVSNSYSSAACRWNGSYGIRTRVCI